MRIPPGLFFAPDRFDAGGGTSHGRTAATEAVTCRKLRREGIRTEGRPVATGVPSTKGGLRGGSVRN